MKNNCSISFFVCRCLVCLVVILAGCGSDNKSGEKKSDVDVQKPSTRDEESRKSSSTFEEFISKKKDLALKIYPTRYKGNFDLEEAIELYVEIYNPRYLAYQMYQNNLSDDQPKPQFNDFLIGSEEHSWKENLTLFDVTNARKIAVSFIYTLDTNQARLNVGQGEIGSFSILIAPGKISTEGTHNLLLKYSENNKNIDLVAKTSVIFKRDYLDKLQRDVNAIYYLLADGKKQEALNQTLELVKSSPESFRARALLGQVFEKNDMTKEAITAYRRSLQLYKVEEGQGYVPEYPQGIWTKIRELDAKDKQ